MTRTAGSSTIEKTDSGEAGSTQIAETTGSWRSAKADPHSSQSIEPREVDISKHGRQSVFVRAMSAFLLMNILLIFYSPLNFDKFNFPYKGWAWWTFNDVRNSTDVKNVALLGSSLMVSATNACDATFLNRDINLVSYHKASFLDHLLHERLGGEFNTYNLAAPGQMPSDAYMTLTAMLKTSHRPEVVVYGVAPRDFIDSSLSSPLDTEPFRFLHRLVNLDDVMPMMFRSPLAKLNWLLESSFYLYGNALDIQMLLNGQLEKVLEIALAVPTGKEPLTYWERTRLLPEYKAGEIHPHAIVVSPTPADAPHEFQDNTEEYRHRYKKPDDRTYRTQFYFLNKLGELCKRERIELVVVNMPITLDNIRLLGSYQYMAYVNALRHFSQESDIPAFDLNDFSIYSKLDFHDGVHLNARGGEKFFRQLTEIMLATTRTKTALELAGEKLARQRALAGRPTPTSMEPSPLEL